MPCSTWNGATVASDTDPLTRPRILGRGHPSGAMETHLKAISIAPESAPDVGDHLSSQPPHPRPLHATNPRDAGNHPPPASFPDQQTPHGRRSPYIGTHVKGTSTRRYHPRHLPHRTNRTRGTFTDEGVSTGGVVVAWHHLRARQLPPAPTPHPRPVTFHGCGALSTPPRPTTPYRPIGCGRTNAPVTLHRRATPLK